MKQVNEETKMNVKELSKEELENTFGGSYWEVIVTKDGVLFIFHLKD